VLAGKCESFLEHYLLPQRSGQVFTHLKLASSLDGKIACASGASQWLSGPESLGLAHYLRWKYDGILVGYRTVLADNPKLTSGRTPWPDTIPPIRLRDCASPCALCLTRASSFAGG
jgi:diaminohydroxyphosphoribosylaminopyrimidine deaminase/5-amino-6-(5-phosphoribosylamino)uracil reductase